MGISLIEYFEKTINGAEVRFKSNFVDFYRFFKLLEYKKKKIFREIILLHINLFVKKLIFAENWLEVTLYYM